MMCKKWPLHPKPEEYQLLQSWIKKLAEIYEVSFESFCKNALSLTREEIGNLRKELPEKALVILSEGTGVPIEDLRGRDLYGTFKKIHLELNKMIEEDPENFKYVEEMFQKRFV